VAIPWFRWLFSGPLTTEARIRALVSVCEMFGGQSGTGKGFSSSSSVFPRQYHSIVALHSYITWGMNKRLAPGRISDKSSHPIDTNKILLHAADRRTTLGILGMRLCTLIASINLYANLVPKCHHLSHPITPCHP
jgi:hypothetical protein